MVFAAPAYGWLALPIILVFLLTLRSQRLRQHDLQQLAEPPLLERLLPVAPRSRSVFRLLLPICGMLCLVVALMRPQWGIVDEMQSVVGLDIVVALDVSRSMLADDAAPTRLAVAKKGIAQLLDRSAGDRIGLLAFAGSAFLVCPLTSDYAIARQMLAELGPEAIPKGGSSLIAALAEAERSFQGTAPGGRLLLVVTDGEDHTGEIAPALERLRRAGIAVIAAQVGSPEGGLIPLPGGTFVKDRTGAVVKSRANLAPLQLLTPSVVSLGLDGSGLTPLVAKARGEGRESARQQRRRKLAERFQYPLSLAVVLFGFSLLPSRGVKR